MFTDHFCIEPDFVTGFVGEHSEVELANGLCAQQHSISAQFSKGFGADVPGGDARIPHGSTEAEDSEDPNSQESGTKVGRGEEDSEDEDEPR